MGNKKKFIQPIIKKKLKGTPWHSNQTLALPKYYIQNASLEISWVKNPLKKNSISGSKIIPFFPSRYEGFDINTAEDLKIALVLSKKKILKFIMKKILIFETFPISPHFETSLEIAVKMLKKGTKCIFFGEGTICLGQIGNYPNIKKYYFFHIPIKLKKLWNFLKKNSVMIIDKVDIDKKINLKIIKIKII